MNTSFVLAAQRIVVGLLMGGHGLQKLAGWFRGHGLAASASMFSSLGCARSRAGLSSSLCPKRWSRPGGPRPVSRSAAMISAIHGVCDACLRPA